MKMVRRTAVVATAIAALVLAGCGSASNETAFDDPGTGDTAAPGSDAGDSDTSTDDGNADASDDNGADTSDAPTGSAIVIGSADFLESELIAQIYAHALIAAGIDATTHLNIGSREIYLQAMEEGSVTVFPEYTGGLLAYYAPDSDAHSSDDVYTDLQAALPNDLTVLEYSPAEDKDSLTVTRETADKYNLTSIGDLAPVAGDMTLGGSPEWQTRADGPQGMAEVYGVDFKDYKVLDPGGPLSVKGLVNGLVDATDIFTTNPAIAENDFVVLDDPENLFLAQNIVPLIAESAVSDEVSEVLNAVSAKLTTEGLTDMLAQIDKDKSDPADVAATWVTANGLD